MKLDLVTGLQISADMDHLDNLQDSDRLREAPTGSTSLPFASADSPGGACLNRFTAAICRAENDDSLPSCQGQFWRQESA